MRSISNGFHIGELTLGCRLCEKGAKLVLFVTGICGEKCFFCPLSEKRKGKDVTWANERTVRSVEDIIVEAQRMRAEGAGITGGDPLVRIERTLGYISALKSSFGRDFHIHLYTGSPIKRDDVSMLKRIGLDEVRFHLIDYLASENEDIWQSIAFSIEKGINTGIEIPAIPGSEDRIVSIARRLEEMGGGFLNLNELEFSDTNFKELEKLGYELKSELSYAVRGSEETAKKVANAWSGFNIHYCSSSFKDSVQLKNRLLRTAKNTAKKYEFVSEEGLLIKGIVEICSNGLVSLESLRKGLIHRYGIPEGLIELDIEKKRIETSIEVAEFLAENHRKMGVKYSIVEEYPTADRLETSKTPL